MYGGINFSPDDLAKLLGDQIGRNFAAATPIPFLNSTPNSAEPIRNTDSEPTLDSKNIKIAELVYILQQVQPKLEEAIRVAMDGAPGYIPDKVKPLQGQNICGPAAEGLALLLSEHGIESEIVTIELPDLANYAAKSHTFLRIKDSNSLIVDPSYMQFLKGFTDCKRLDNFPSIALFRESDLASVVDSLVSICAKSTENIFTAVRYDLSGAVKRQSLLSQEQVKKYILGIWSITESNYTLKDKDYLNSIKTAHKIGNLSQLPPLRGLLLDKLFSAE
jgi:hypothetical protein